MSAPDNIPPLPGVCSSDLLGVREMARLIALIRWITQAHLALSRSLIVVENRHRGFEKWFKIECRIAGGANLRLTAKPTKAARNFLSAARAMCRNKGRVKHTAAQQELLDLLRSDLWNFHAHVTLPNAKLRDAGESGVEQH